MSGLSGVAAALAVPSFWTVYFRSRYRSFRDIVRHGLAAALARSGSSLSWPTICGTRRSPISASTRQSLRSNLKSGCRTPPCRTSPTPRSNCAPTEIKKLAQLQGALAPGDDGRSVLKGSVVLDYRTIERFMILTLPGQAQYQFKLRLAANPSHCDQFGPWHLADRMASPNKEAPDAELHDAFAIRYRVI